MVAIVDLTFRRFAAPSIAKFIYALYMAPAVLLSIIAIIYTMQNPRRW